MGSWARRAPSSEALRSAWYRLPHPIQAGPLIVVSAAGKERVPGAKPKGTGGKGDEAIGLRCSGIVVQPTSAPHGWRNHACPTLAAIPRDCTQVRLVRLQTTTPQTTLQQGRGLRSAHPAAAQT